MFISKFPAVWKTYFNAYGNDTIFIKDDDLEFLFSDADLISMFIRMQENILKIAHTYCWSVQFNKSFNNSK